jgi:hypothetical protein
LSAVARKISRISAGDSSGLTLDMSPAISAASGVAEDVPPNPVASLALK